MTCMVRAVVVVKERFHFTMDSAAAIKRSIPVAALSSRFSFFFGLYSQPYEM